MRVWRKIKRGGQMYIESMHYLKASFKHQMPENKSSIATATNLEIRRLLYGEFRANWQMAGGIILCLIFAAFAEVTLPMIMRYLINDVLIPKKMALLWGALFGFLAVYGVQSGCQSMQIFLSGRLQGRLNLHLKDKLTAHLLKLPGEFFDRVSSGYLASRVFEDVRSLTTFFGQPMQTFLLAACKISGATVMLFYLKWQLALALLAVLPLFFAAARFFGRKQYTLAASHSESTSAAYGRLQETLSNIKLVKSSGDESGTLKTHRKDYAGLYQINMEMTSLTMMFQRLMTWLPDACRFAVLILACLWVLNGEWQIGDLTAVSALVMSMIIPTRTLAFSMVQLTSAQASLGRLSALLKLIPEDNLESGVKVDKLAGKVEFKQVNFQYLPNQPVLKNFNLAIEPGKITAIVGASGAGKSTLAGLLMHFYRAPDGEIRLDDRLIDDYNMRALRKRIGFLGTDMKLFNATLRENLCYGGIKADDRELTEMLNELGLAMLTAAPYGLDWLVEENAKNLSAGQQQRIALARELLRNGDMLILDEPTSALDAEHEVMAAAAIHKHAGTRTVIIITHRECLAKLADSVVWLKDGSCIAQGTFADLDYQF